MPRFIKRPKTTTFKFKGEDTDVYLFALKAAAVLVPRDSTEFALHAQTITNAFNEAIDGDLDAEVNHPLDAACAGNLWHGKYVDPITTPGIVPEPFQFAPSLLDHALQSATEAIASLKAEAPTLRDRFAMEATNAFLKANVKEKVPDYVLTKAIYRFADAMLKQRDSKP